MAMGVLHSVGDRYGRAKPPQIIVAVITSRLMISHPVGPSVTQVSFFKMGPGLKKLRSTAETKYKGQAN